MFNKSSPFSKAPDPVVGRSPVKPAVQAPSVPAGAMAESAAVLSPGHDMARGESVAGKGGAATPTTGMDEGRPSRLIVGPDVKLKGAEILDCDTLVVEGRVEATNREGSTVLGVETLTSPRSSWANSKSLTRPSMCPSPDHSPVPRTQRASRRRRIACSPTCARSRRPTWPGWPPFTKPLWGCGPWAEMAPRVCWAPAGRHRARRRARPSRARGRYGRA